MNPNQLHAMKKYNKHTYRGVSYKYIIEQLSENSFCVRRRTIAHPEYYFPAWADINDVRFMPNSRYVSCRHPINQDVNWQSKYYPKTALDAYRMLVDLLLQAMVINIDDVDMVVDQYRKTHLEEENEI